MYYSAIFFVQICLIQYALSQRVNAPAMVNNGLQYGPNVGHGGPLQGQLNRIAPEHGGVIGGPGINQLGPNQAIGQYGQILPNNPAFAGAGVPNQVYNGIPNQVFNGVSMPNQVYNGPGNPNSPYGGAGTGDVAVTGELPVAGMTTVTGHVPMTGKVTFNGNVPCGGIVTITGSCASCGNNVPFGQTPAFGNKPYGY